MMRTYKNTQKALVTLLLIIFLIFSSCTVKKISEMEDGGDGGDEYSTWTKSGKEFDPVQYVDSIWESKLIPAFHEESVELTAVLEALKNSREEAVQQYGLKGSSDEIKPIFKVKGNAVVLSYDDSSRNGLLVLDIVPADGQEDVLLQVGPVIRKTALRDSVSFINFTDIGNQIQFASLADELNARMRREAVDPLDLENLEEKEISFYGAFNLEEDDTYEDVVITPLTIELVNEESPENPESPEEEE